MGDRCSIAFASCVTWSWQLIPLTVPRRNPSRARLSAWLIRRPHPRAYSIISSARASSVSGTPLPSALAVLSLKVDREHLLVGASTGRQALRSELPRHRQLLCAPRVATLPPHRAERADDLASMWLIECHPTLNATNHRAAPRSGWRAVARAFALIRVRRVL